MEQAFHPLAQAMAEALFAARIAAAAAAAATAAARGGNDRRGRGRRWGGHFLVRHLTCKTGRRYQQEHSIHEDSSIMG
jgi:hypothetical protein